jgi:hypothetical protein
MQTVANNNSWKKLSCMAVGKSETICKRIFNSDGTATQNVYQHNISTQSRSFAHPFTPAVKKLL